MCLHATGSSQWSHGDQRFLACSKRGSHEGVCASHMLVLRLLYRWVGWTMRVKKLFSSVRNLVLLSLTLDSWHGSNWLHNLFYAYAVTSICGFPNGMMMLFFSGAQGHLREKPQLPDVTGAHGPRHSAYIRNTWFLRWVTFAGIQLHSRRRKPYI